MIDKSFALSLNYIVVFTRLKRKALREAQLMFIHCLHFPTLDPRFSYEIFMCITQLISVDISGRQP